MSSLGDVGDVVWDQFLPVFMGTLPLLLMLVHMLHEDNHRKEVGVLLTAS